MAHAHFFATQPELYRCVLMALIRMVNDGLRSALPDGHVHRVEHKLRLQMVFHHPARIRRL